MHVFNVNIQIMLFSIFVVWFLSFEIESSGTAFTCPQKFKLHVRKNFRNDAIRIAGGGTGPNREVKKFCAPGNKGIDKRSLVNQKIKTIKIVLHCQRFLSGENKSLVQIQN